jgi:hypothetical protein
VLPDDNAMNWRKLAIGSRSIGVTTADSDAMENMIARSALLNRSSMAAACWECGADD